MAQLTNTLINGDLRVTGTIYGETFNNKIDAAASTANENYKLLAAAAAPSTGTTNTTAVYDADVTLNPSTNTISANISGKSGTLNATYSGNGGQLAPGDITKGTVRAAMMNAPKGLTAFNTYCDCILMDTYTGTDVPYVTGLGISRNSGKPKMYIFNGAQGNTTTWTNEQEVYTTATTVSIANGGTGATQVTGTSGAVHNLTNDNIGTSSQYFLTITSDWSRCGYCNVANAKTVLGLGSAAYKADTYFAPTSHTDTSGAYGKGTTSNYGHVKLVVGDMNGATNADGEAPSKNHTHSQYATAYNVSQMESGLRSNINSRFVYAMGLKAIDSYDDMSISFDLPQIMFCLQNNKYGTIRRYQLYVKRTSSATSSANIRGTCIFQGYSSSGGTSATSKYFQINSTSVGSSYVNIADSAIAAEGNTGAWNSSGRLDVRIDSSYTIHLDISIMHPDGATNAYLLMHGWFGGAS